MVQTLDNFQRQLCDIQGRLFELSLKKELDSAEFIEKFMNSNTCEFFDLPYDRLQWAGEEYILETLLDEVNISKKGKTFTIEEMYWIGYLYRYWHFYTKESSRDIYAQADSELMRSSYLGFHTLDATVAIENFKEIHRQKNETSCKSVNQ